MRYERLADILRLAIRLQGARGGLAMDDIQDEFAVSRRTAERMRAAAEDAFGPLELVETGEKRLRWRLRSRSLGGLVRFSADELAELQAATELLERDGLSERAATLRDLGGKARALSRARSPEELEAEFDAIMQAEGLAMRAGPRQRLEDGLLSLLRDAIMGRRVVAFDYLGRASGKRGRQRVRPYGLLRGNRSFLVGRADWADDTRLWRLAGMSDVRIEREGFRRDPAFDLRRYAERSFGTFQEKPVGVVLRFSPAAAPDAAAFQFHPGQAVAWNEDGSLTVRFRAGGIDEMCWHLVTWGDAVAVERPVRLRRRLAGMCAALAAHHRA